MRNILLASTVIVFSLSTPAVAQSEGSDGSADIIVTANRTESLLSKTPIAMTAVTGAELIQAGVTNPTQLEVTVPNLNIVRNNGLQISIRGVTSSDNTEKGDPSAAFMLNGIYIARPQAQEVSFYDIERVEVLRGPQGTLYGRNSTAGVINVLSARPKKEFGASVDASYANFNDVNATAALNVPLGEAFAVRAAVNVDRRNSFIIDGNPNDGVSLNPFKKNVSGRLSALFEPNDDLSVLLIGDYSKIEGVADLTVPVSNFYSNIVTGPRSTFDRPTFLNRNSSAYRRLTAPLSQQGRRDSSDKGVMGELNYKLGSVALTYLGSYREFDQLDFRSYASGSIPSRFDGQYWQTSHELRLALVDTGRLQAQVGGYYFKEKSGISLELFNLIGPNTGYAFVRNPTESENKSAFAQATYELFPELKLTGGIRYSHDTKSRFGETLANQYTNVVSAYNTGAQISSISSERAAADRSFSRVTWRAGIDYDSPLGLIFASVATGYKAGGFNDGCQVGQGAGCNSTEEALYYNPETLTSYEAGFKFRISREFHLNGTVFHYDYQNLQLSQTQNICGPDGTLACSVTRNAAVAKVDGVELDAQIKPTRNFSVNLGLNYLDARYASFIPEPGVDFSGRPLARSPKWTANVGASYTMPVGEGELVADVNSRFSSSYDLTFQSSYTYFYQPSFTKTDLNLTYRAPESRYYIGAFVKNLEDAITVSTVAQDGFNDLTFGDPRQYGIRAGVKF